MFNTNTESFNTAITPPKPRINIEKLIETALPSSPGGLMRIKNMLLDYNTSTNMLSTAISYEPALSARIIRLANSPLYALGKMVTSIPMAINVVGSMALYDIILMELTSATFGGQIRNSPYAKKIWNHSLAVAVIAREISKSLGLRGTEEAFTCGLLHDIGKIVLLSNDPEGFIALQDTDDEGEMLMREKRTYGYNHTEVGSLIVRRWGLPDGIGYTILHHHNASQASAAVMMACLIDTADVIANIKGYGVRQEQDTKLLFSESPILLELSEDFLETEWSRIEVSIREVIRSFS